MTTPNYMAQLGATLVDRGFPILPIQPRSKKPGMYRQGAWHDYPKWSRHCERATTENEVDIWGDWPESGIGIAAATLLGYWWIKRRRKAHASELRRAAGRE